MKRDGVLEAKLRVWGLQYITPEYYDKCYSELETKLYYW